MDSVQMTNRATGTPDERLPKAAGAGRASHDVESPDIETSSDAYAGRFRGGVGAWFLEVQAREVLRLLRQAGGGALPETVLELGGGHAQLAGPLAAAGIRLDVQGSVPACVARLSRIIEAHPDLVSFKAARLTALPFADASYDAVVAVRLMAHVERWRPLLADMARLSRRTILVDFAPDDGFQKLADASFGLKRRVESNTRPFFTHSIREVEAALSGLGFTEITWHRQFILPMAAHRALGRPGLSRAAEAVARTLGLDRLTGGPVLMCASRPR